MKRERTRALRLRTGYAIGRRAEVPRAFLEF
jgi:hypothetical protein